MKSKPLVSIITPSFNQAEYLESTILSVLNQDYPNIEYIVIDGGSADGSVEIIRKYENQIAYWISEKDQGQTDALNKGFSVANGEIFAWINSDDLLLPGAVSQAVHELLAHPTAAMVYGQADYIDNKGNVIGHFPARQTNLKKLKNGFVHIPQQASFFRAENWHKVAPLDPSFNFAMDYDLWVRLAKMGELIFVQKVWAQFRLHANAKTIYADNECWPEMLRVHFRDGGSIFAPIVFKYCLRKLIAPLIQWKRRRLFRKINKENL